MPSTHCCWEGSQSHRCPETAGRRHPDCHQRWPHGPTARVICGYPASRPANQCSTCRCPTCRCPSSICRCPTCRCPTCHCPIFRCPTRTGPSCCFELGGRRAVISARTGAPGAEGYRRRRLPSFSTQVVSPRLPVRPRNWGLFESAWLLVNDQLDCRILSGCGPLELE